MTGRHRFFLLVGLLWAGLASAAPAPIAYKQVPIGKAVLSLPAHWTSFGPEVPVWLHLHGARQVVEDNFNAINAPAVLVTLTLPGLSKVYADHFAAPGAFDELLRAVEAALRSESTAQPWRLGRITVSSFSAGFGGVRQLLRQPEAFRRISALVMADSIYCGYVGAPAERRVDPELMAGFLEFARLATEGQKRLLISHSRQVPEGYASTTETADYLIQQLAGARTLETQELGGGLRLLSHFSRGRLDILGFDGDSPDDHMRHLRSIGVLFERAQPATARPATTVAQLRAQLDALVTHPRFDGAAWGVKVSSLETGRLLYTHHETRLLSPASNSKLYASALALDRLGADYRIVTPIVASAKPDSAGLLRGDLIVIGRGDPSWTSGSPRGDFWRIFEPFVAAVEKAGVRRIAGDVVADATFFRGPPNGAGWTADDLNDYYGAEISAVTLEDNYTQLRLAPAATAGQPAVLTLLQPHTGLLLDNRTTTTAAGGARRFEVRRILGENVVHVFGDLPLGTAVVVEDVTVPRPVNWFAAALKEALGRRGIAVDGAARGLRWPDAPAASAAVVLGEISSPPMREMVSGLMKPSQNLQTDLIFAHVGETLRNAETPAWRTSEQLGVAALREFLRQHGLAPDEVRFEEGSGLSRNNLTSANATLALLTFMATHRHAADFSASLPIAGVDGTLRRRMKATPAEGNVRAKTGTLRWAIALSGYVTSAAGERLAFSVMLNRAVAPAGRNPRDDVDAIAVMLAAFAGRSDAND